MLVKVHSGSLIVKDKQIYNELVGILPSDPIDPCVSLSGKDVYRIVLWTDRLFLFISGQQPILLNLKKEVDCL